MNLIRESLNNGLSYRDLKDIGYPTSVTRKAKDGAHMSFVRGVLPAAKRIGVSPETYVAYRLLDYCWCWRARHWIHESDRAIGADYCRACDVRRKRV